METKFETIDGRSTQFRLLLGVLVLLILAGLWSTWVMYWQGLHVTGMTNRVPWGLQIIMAVFYVGLSAGSLVISSLYAIFGKKEYKAFARISVTLAILFLVAALLSIILDWGRPDRIFVPFQYFNPLSMFTINPFLYISYILICVVYLWAMFTERAKFIPVIATIAVLWAIGVHSGTGAIFGFVPRELYQSALSPPSFISAALSSGTAMMILVILGLFRLTKRPLDEALLVRLGGLLGIFIFIVMYFIAVENIYRVYLPQSHHAGMFFLFGGTHSLVFWIGMIFIGMIVPVFILFSPKTGRSIPWISFASILVVFGVLCERYLIVVPGQLSPPELFPGWEITYSVLEEGPVTYTIGWLEVVQAVGILAIISFAFVLGLRFLKLLPTEARSLEA
jgi:molybdopterin-containing oxidoreductase family membrane subunit